MSHWGAACVYLLCLAASVLCAGLLARTWRMTGSRLLLWTSVSFGFLALNNLLLVCDALIFLHVDLWPYRQATFLAGLAVLLFGFIWETL